MKVGLIYTRTTPELIELVEQEVKKQLSEDVELYSLQDPSVLADVREAGYVTTAPAARLIGMYMKAAEEGVDAMLNLCSSVGEVADSVQDVAKYIGVPSFAWTRRCAARPSAEQRADREPGRQPGRERHEDQQPRSGSLGRGNRFRADRQRFHLRRSAGSAERLEGRALSCFPSESVSNANIVGRRDLPSAPFYWKTQVFQVLCQSN